MDTQPCHSSTHLSLPTPDRDDSPASGKAASYAALEAEIERERRRMLHLKRRFTYTPFGPRGAPVYNMSRGRYLGMRKALRILKAADYVPEWIRTDERLPEPGVPVIAYYKNRQGKGRRVHAYYAGKFQLAANMDYGDGTWADYHEEEDKFYAPEGWYEFNENEEVHWQIYETVSHWMPLPEPPPGT